MLRGGGFLCRVVFYAISARSESMKWADRLGLTWATLFLCTAWVAMDPTKPLGVGIYRDMTRPYDVVFWSFSPWFILMWIVYGYSSSPISRSDRTFRRLSRLPFIFKALQFNVFIAVTCLCIRQHFTDNPMAGVLLAVLCSYLATKLLAWSVDLSGRGAPFIRSFCGLGTVHDHR